MVAGELRRWGSCGGDGDAWESGNGDGCDRPSGAELTGGRASSFLGLLPRLLLLPTTAGTNYQEEMSEGKGNTAGGLPRLREGNVRICGFLQMREGRRLETV
jgi:hypothetical protein